MQGHFITLEGGEGAGKSTQARMLAETLQKRGYEVVLTREPGGTPGAEQIRGLLLHGAEAGWDAHTELLLFLAARRDHVEKIVKPAMEKRAWVICDRYQDSTTAYQGYARGLGAAYVESLYAMIFGNFWPDTTLILNIAPDQGLARARRETGAKHDRFESESVSFHAQLHEGYLDIARRWPERCRIIDASGKPEEVQARMLSALLLEQEARNAA